MFGIGGGELIFILFIVLMLFGSDKVPEIARTMGKAMAQLKNATNDIKSEIQKGAESNGFDQKMLNDLTGSVTSEINSVKSNLIGDVNPLNGISDAFSTEIDKTKNSLLDGATPQVDKVVDEIEDITGPIKRKM
ncbi:MAG: twin-arginine translocase TatA/TatE family subunit [Bacteroidota bacterium]